jgi:AcrR family transcriptional regulator
MCAAKNQQAARHSPGVDRVRSRARSMYREAIIEAAEEELASSGFHGARIQDIAKRAGVAVGTFYNHFETKEDVLLALLDLRMREITGILAPSRDDPERWADRLVTRLTRLLEYKDRHVPFFVLAVEHGLLGDATGAAQHLLGERPLPHAGRFDRAMLDLVDEGLAANAIEDGDRELQAAFLKNTIRAVARWGRDKGSVPPRDIALTIVALFLGGVGRRPVTEPRKRPSRR